MAAISGSDRARAALTYLRRKITTGEWPVGERIPIEPELAAQMGVGRSTVREAVRSLASMGMLETAPGRGTFVRSAQPTSSILNEFLSDFSLEEILSYRRALEIEAAQQAAMHRSETDLIALELALEDDLGCTHCPVLTLSDSGTDAFNSRFHRVLFEAAKNRLLSSLYAGINEQLRLPAHRGKLAKIATSSDNARDHRRLLEAIRRKDFIDAVHAMAEHVDTDVVVVNDARQTKQPVKRTAEQQRRIDDVREGLPAATRVQAAF